VFNDEGVLYTYVITHYYYNAPINCAHAYLGHISNVDQTLNEFYLKLLRIFEKDFSFLKYIHFL
jgi:hypothetical protein